MWYKCFLQGLVKTILFDNLHGNSSTPKSPLHIYAQRSFRTSAPRHPYVDPPRDKASSSTAYARCYLNYSTRSFERYTSSTSDASAYPLTTRLQADWPAFLEGFSWAETGEEWFQGHTNGFQFSLFLGLGEKLPSLRQLRLYISALDGQQLRL